MRKTSEQFTQVQSDEEDEIHIINTTLINKPTVKKKQISVFTLNPEIENIQLSIIGYDKQSYFKIQTQIYNIEVKDLKKDEMWIIKRRYSDVLWLYETLSIGHIGYIIPFFPTKTIESFFAAKLSLTINKERKDDFLNERIYMINNFLRNIYNHDKLKYSDQARIFISKLDTDFLVERKKIQSYIEEYRELQSNSSGFLSIIEKGSSLISSYLGSKKLARQITKQDEQFQKYEQKIIEQQNSVKLLSKNIEELANVKSKEAEITLSESDIDKLQIINTKLHLGRQINQKLSETLLEDIVKPLNTFSYWIEQVHQTLEHRKTLVEFIFNLKQNIEDFSRIKKLERRLEKLENNFRQCFKEWCNQVESQSNGLIKEYKKIWENYSVEMRKIWK